MSGSNIVNANLDKWAAQRLAGVQGVATITAAKAAAQAKALPQSESWKDHTRDARKGLYGKASKEGTNITVELGHRVSYGVSLELANDCKHAVLEKTLNSLRQEFLSSVKQIMESKF